MACQGKIVTGHCTVVFRGKVSMFQCLIGFSTNVHNIRTHNIRTHNIRTHARYCHGAHSSRPVKASNCMGLHGPLLEKSCVTVILS